MGVLPPIATVWLHAFSFFVSYPLNDEVWSTEDLFELMAGDTIEMSQDQREKWMEKGKNLKKGRMVNALPTLRWP